MNTHRTNVQPSLTVVFFYDVDQIEMLQVYENKMKQGSPIMCTSFCWLLHFLFLWGGNFMRSLTLGPDQEEIAYFKCSSRHDRLILALATTNNLTLNPSMEIFSKSA